MMTKQLKRLMVFGWIIGTTCLAADRVEKDAGPVAAEPVKVTDVWIVIKTHHDIGFICMASEWVNDFAHKLDTVLASSEVSDTSPEAQPYVWMAQGWPIKMMLDPGQDAKRRERLVTALKHGHVAITASPFSMEAEWMETEDLVRGLGFSSRIARELSLPLPTDSIVTDVPNTSRGYVTVLQHAGVKFLHIGANPAAATPDVPALYWWEAPDGSRLLTMYTTMDYGTSSVTPPRNWPSRNWLALYVANESLPPYDSQTIRTLVAEAKQKMPNARIHVGTLAEFGNAVIDENPSLPVVRRDMGDSWMYGIASMPQETAMARNWRPTIGTLEALNTELNCWKVKVPSVKQTVADAYEQSLLFGEHTWAYHDPKSSILKYGAEFEKARASGIYKKFEASFAEHGDYARGLVNLVSPALATNLEALTRAVSVSGKRVTVFNPLPWMRGGLVEVAYGARAMKDAVTGELLPCEPYKRGVRFQASAVPAMGYRTFIPVEELPSNVGSVLRAEGRLMENAFFRVELDPARGAIRSIHDKRTGRELVDPGASHGFGQYLYERFDYETHWKFLRGYCKVLPDWAEEFGKRGLPRNGEKYSAASPVDFTLDLKTNMVCATATMRASAGHGIPQPVSLRVTLYASQPVIDLEWSIENKPVDPWPEAGWLCLPFNVRDPEFRLSRQNSIIDPAKDIVPKSNVDLFTLTGGMTISPAGEKTGVGLCALDVPMVSLGFPGAYQFHPAWTARKPEVLIHLFNNVWGCNFAAWIGGSWSSRVRIWPTTDLIEPSWEARMPLLAAVADAPAGTLPLSREGLTLSRSGVLVTAFGANPDGEGTVLRLWEQTGKTGEITVLIPGEFTTAVPVNLRGQERGAALPIHSGKLTFDLPAYAPASFILR